MSLFPYPASKISKYATLLSSVVEYITFVFSTNFKKYLLDDFKRMSKDRQILLITHNPQFVVNLNVDNVICITKNNDKKLKLLMGP